MYKVQKVILDYAEYENVNLFAIVESRLMDRTQRTFETIVDTGTDYQEAVDKAKALAETYGVEYENKIESKNVAKFYQEFRFLDKKLRTATYGESILFFMDDLISMFERVSKDSIFGYDDSEEKDFYYTIVDESGHREFENVEFCINKDNLYSLIYKDKEYGDSTEDSYREWIIEFVVPYLDKQFSILEDWKNDFDSDLVAVNGYGDKLQEWDRNWYYKHRVKDELFNRLSKDISAPIIHTEIVGDVFAYNWHTTVSKDKNGLYYFCADDLWDMFHLTDENEIKEYLIQCQIRYPELSQTRKWLSVSEDSFKKIALENGMSEYEVNLYVHSIPEQEEYYKNL